MESILGSCLKRTYVLLASSFCSTLYRAASYDCSSYAVSSSPQRLESTHESDVKFIASRIRAGSSPDEILLSLMNDQSCNKVEVSSEFVDKLLFQFKNDWKSALGVFRWVGLHPGYKHAPEAYDMMVDILGKMRQMDQMRALLEEMKQIHLVTLKTVGKAMRRFSGAGKWEDAVELFDQLDTFGLEKDTESMNLLLDTLCKEGKVEQARAIFLELKPHISPNANTFNIFIHGWCKANRVDEAHWTLQEMKGHGCDPCVISYSTIVLFYCRQNNFYKVYELLDEMEAQRCPANVVTYTSIMCFLSKSQDFQEALQVAQRMKSAGCKPDTLFYNSLISVLARVGQLQEAVHVFEKEMANTGVPRNTSTYNSMISMFCHHGQLPKALNLLKEMETLMHCKPDGQTYYPLLKSCIRIGDLNLLSQLLSDMFRKHHLSLDISAYALLIHGLCRANRCEWAYQLFEEMIGKDIVPKYQTCRMLLEVVKLKNMYDAAEKIEDFMRKL